MSVASEPSSDSPSFEQIGLPKFLLSLLREVGYESPSPIQAQTIPLLLNGRDLVGQAQTGTGKTAAFALPALAKLDKKGKVPQVLVLTPTRELSIQVAEAFQTYAGHMKGFSVLPVYGGQDYRIQVNAIKRGAQVIVSTPGRLMDHIRRGVLSLEHLQLLVLDEADEMLRMGFIDDVQWILEQTPDTRQIALFSATMPAPIRRIAQKHLNNPATVEIKGKSNVTATIRQRYWPVQGVHKLDALTRILEAETTDGVIVFVRTKTASAELADKLAARGMRSSALNGEMAQKLREKTVDRLRKGNLDILVATDVAARGLDVERISHVINYDIPYDTESYVHRIGRTGRAGRSGEAIMFVAPRERRMLAMIEKAVGSSIEKLTLPTVQDINEQRAQRLLSDITNTLEKVDLSTHKAVVEQYLGEHEVRGADVAAALAYMLQKSNTKVAPVVENNTRATAAPKAKVTNTSRTAKRPERTKESSSAKPSRKPASMPKLEEGMERFRLEVGQSHGAEPGKIVGAIANEGGIDSQYFGRISIHEEFSLIDLPDGMPKEIFKDLKKTRVCGMPLRISRVSMAPGAAEFGEPQPMQEKRKPRKKTQAKSRKPSDKKSGKKPQAKSDLKSKKRAETAKSGKKKKRKKTQDKTPA